jgi:hypothetical protein
LCAWPAEFIATQPDAAQFIVYERPLSWCADRRDVDPNCGVDINIFAVQGLLKHPVQASMRMSSSYGAALIARLIDHPADVATPDTGNRLIEPWG